MSCWKCGGWLVLEPARIFCRHCGQQVEHPEPREDQRWLQILIDYALRSSCPGAIDAWSAEEYAEMIL